MTYAILMLLFPCGLLVFLSSSFGIFLALPTPFSMSFSGYPLFCRNIFKSCNLCSDRFSSLTIVLILLVMLNRILTFWCLG